MMHPVMESYKEKSIAHSAIAMITGEKNKMARVEDLLFPENLESRFNRNVVVDIWVNQS